MPVVNNLHKIRSMLSDPKNQYNEHKIYDDDYYISRLQEISLNPFATYSVTNEKNLKLLRIQILLDLASDEELIRRVQESVSEQGDFDIHRYINQLRYDMSQFKSEMYV